MSWLERLNSELTITTGDGKTFTPLWKPAVKDIEYNTTEFDFPNLNGTYVYRTTVRGTKYSVEFYFQGEDHLDVSNSFELSARDNRAWTISHPFYGNIIVQPLGLQIDNSLYNVSKVTGSVMETITEDRPKITVDPVDKIATDKENLDEVTVNCMDTEPSLSDVNTMTSTTAKIYAQGSKLGLNAEQYFNLFNTANSKITQATSYPIDAMRAIVAIINAPALFETSVSNRQDVLHRQFDLTRETIEGATKRASKLIYQITNGTILSAHALSLSTPQKGDYNNRTDVLRIMQVLIDDYHAYLSDLDSLQTDNGGEVESYIPDADAMIGLNNLINYTISSLFNIALGARQERTIYLEDDSNVINLTHRFYGLDEADENIDEFILNNNIGLNEILQVRKGRKLVYYV